MCVLVLFGIRKGFIVWIKYYDIRTSIILVCKDFCLGLFALRNLLRLSFDGIYCIRIFVKYFTTLRLSSGVIVRMQE